jgi:hypothetical protein
VLQKHLQKHLQMPVSDNILFVGGFTALVLGMATDVIVDKIWGRDVEPRKVVMDLALASAVAGIVASVSLTRRS